MLEYVESWIEKNIEGEKMNNEKLEQLLNIQGINLNEKRRITKEIEELEETKKYYELNKQNIKNYNKFLNDTNQSIIEKSEKLEQINYIISIIQSNLKKYQKSIKLKIQITSLENSLKQSKIKESNEISIVLKNNEIEKEKIKNEGSYLKKELKKFENIKEIYIVINEYIHKLEKRLNEIEKNEEEKIKIINKKYEILKKNREEKLRKSVEELKNIEKDINVTNSEIDQLPDNKRNRYNKKTIKVKVVNKIKNTEKKLERDKSLKIKIIKKDKDINMDTQNIISGEIENDNSDNENKINSKIGTSIYQKAYLQMLERTGRTSNNYEFEFQNEKNVKTKKNYCNIDRIMLNECGLKYIQINNCKFNFNRKLDNKTKREIYEICKKIVSKGHISTIKEIIAIGILKSKIDPAIVNGIKQYLMPKLEQWNNDIINYEKMKKIPSMLGTAELGKAHINAMDAKSQKELFENRYYSVLEKYIMSIEKGSLSFPITYDCSKNINFIEYGNIINYIKYAEKAGAKIIGKPRLFKLFKEQREENEFFEYVLEPARKEKNTSFIPKINLGLQPIRVESNPKIYEIKNNHKYYKSF